MGLVFFVEQRPICKSMVSGIDIFLAGIFAFEKESVSVLFSLELLSGSNAGRVPLRSYAIDHGEVVFVAW